MVYAKIIINRGERHHGQKILLHLLFLKTNLETEQTTQLNKIVIAQNSKRDM